MIHLEEDLTVYRHYDSVTGSADPTSPWYSPKTYVKPGNARRYLALPDANAANTVSRYVVPKGTTVLYGKVASQVDNLDLFHIKAVGGGMQYNVPNFRVVQLRTP